MDAELLCFRCGASLQELSLPLGRRDECPDCSIDLHVCRMCMFFDSAVPRQCREDDAEEVYEKEKVNFCEWFQPSAEAFDPEKAGQAAQAKNQLDALFGDEPEAGITPDADLQDAEDLFK